MHPPAATVALISLNVLAWVLLQGLGTETALSRSICLYGLVPGDLLGTAAVGSQVAMDHGIVCVLDGQSSWITVVHVDVHARRLAAPDRQHVVPVDLRRQRRRCDGARPFRRVLSVVRARGGGCANALRSVEHRADGRRIGRNRRRDGRIRVAVSARARAHVHISRLLHDDDRGARDLHARLLVSTAVVERTAGTFRRRARRRRVLGARRRIPVLASRWSCCSSSANASKRV